MLRIKNHYKKGLSLLEVIISLVIICLMLTPLLVMYNRSLRHTYNYSTAVIRSIEMNNAMSWLHRHYLNTPMPEYVDINNKKFSYRVQDFPKDSLMATKNLVYAGLVNNNNQEYTYQFELLVFKIKKEESNA